MEERDTDVAAAVGGAAGSIGLKLSAGIGVKLAVGDELDDEEPLCVVQALICNSSRVLLGAR